MMKKTLAVTAAILLACSVTFGQTTGDKNKKNESVSKPAAQQATVTPASKVELNPQPLPPGAKKTTTSPESKVALNPQPLPPGAKKATTSPAGKVELNPQPLPPGPQSDVKKKAAAKTAQSSKKGGTGSTNTTPK